MALAKSGQLPEAERRYREALAGFRQTRPAGDRLIRGTLESLSELLEQLGDAARKKQRFTDAERRLLEAHELCVELHGADHDAVREVAARLAALYEAWHRAEPSAGHDARAAVWRGK